MNFNGSAALALFSRKILFQEIFSGLCWFALTLLIVGITFFSLIGLWITPEHGMALFIVDITSHFRHVYLLFQIGCLMILLPLTVNTWLKRTEKKQASKV
jgi:hypothetical protein